MGKRKNKVDTNGDDLKTPKSELKKPKIEKGTDSDASHSEPDDYEEDHVDAEESKIEEGQYFYEPDALRKLIDSLTAFSEERKSISASVHNMEKLVTEWAGEQEEPIDVGLFIADFRRYLKLATKYKNYRVQDASVTLSHFLGSDKSLSHFKSMPEKPQTKVQLYMKKNKIPFTGLQAMKTVHKKMQEDVEGTQEVDEQLRELTQQYIPQLQEFLKSHPDLSAEQQKFIQTKIKSLAKKFVPKDTTPKTPKTPKVKPVKRGAETAYSLFCRTMFEKYRDLSEDEREKKLQKKFRKLPQDSITLYENLALSL
ncbi:unnamed protein product [Caenorhabditis brenneri]